jgi:hypothetical protein
MVTPAKTAAWLDRQAQIRRAAISLNLASSEHPHASTDLPGRAAAEPGPVATSTELPGE